MPSDLEPEQPLPKGSYARDKVCIFICWSVKKIDNAQLLVCKYLYAQTSVEVSYVWTPTEEQRSLKVHKKRIGLMKKYKFAVDPWHLCMWFGFEGIYITKTSRESLHTFSFCSGRNLLLWRSSGQYRLFQAKAGQGFRRNCWGWWDWRERMEIV